MISEVAEKDISDMGTRCENWRGQNAKEDFFFVRCNFFPAHTSYLRHLQPREAGQYPNAKGRTSRRTVSQQKKHNRRSPTFGICDWALSCGRSKRKKHKEGKINLYTNSFVLVFHVFDVIAYLWRFCGFERRPASGCHPPNANVEGRT